MEFPEFAATLAEYFRLPASLFDPGARLEDDLGFDSIMMLELTDMLEAARGHLLDVETLMGIKTLEDVFALYTAGVSS